MTTYERREKRERNQRIKMGQLPDIDKETCPKCGYTARPRIFYCPGVNPYIPSELYSCVPKDPPYEHLHITCSVCNYTHMVKCKDS